MNQHLRFALILASLTFSVVLNAQVFMQVPAEHERNEGALLVWDYAPSRDSVVANIAGALQDHAKVWIIYYAGQAPYDTSHIRQYLLNRGVGYHNVHFIPGWTETLWIRDYGPITAYKTSGTTFRQFFDAGYSAYNRPKDDSIPSQLGNYWNIPVLNLPLQLEGGNLIFDGFIRAFGSKRILDQNAPMSQEQISNILKDYFALDDFVFLEKLLNSGGGIWMHVDMYMKLIDYETIMVSEYPSHLPDYPVIEGIVDLLSNLTNEFGRNYKIIRIPAPPRADGTYATTLNAEMRTYTNALTINDVVVVPSYNLPMDAVAKQIYEDAMPGYSIKMVDSRTLTPLYGAIHCITREIPQEDMLRIRHAKTEGEILYNHEIPIAANVRSNSPVDTIWIRYRIHPDTGYKRVQMWPTCPGYMGIIDGLFLSDTVSYYIEANSQTNSVTQPLVAPHGVYTFWFDASVGSPAPEIAASAHIYPNPTNGEFSIHVPASGSKLEINIFAADGKLVYNEFIDNEGRIHLPQSFLPGYYLLQYVSDSHSGYAKILLQR
jgi:agmatine deiminase